MFAGCTNLTNIGDISYWNVSNITDMGYMFAMCYNLTSIENLATWDVSKVTDMRYMFSDCQAITTLDLSGWNLESLVSATGMFSFNTCNIKTLILDPKFFNTSVTLFDFSRVTKWADDSVITSLVINLFDRKSAGLETMTLKLASTTYKKLSEDNIKHLEEFGYVIDTTSTISNNEFELNIDLEMNDIFKQ